VSAGGDEAVVRRWLAAVGRDPRALRLATRDLTIVQPDGRTARGRLRCTLMAAQVGWRSRGTLRMEPQSVEVLAPGRVRARTRNTARAGARTLDLEMTLDFELRDGRIASMTESVDEMDAWRAFWRP
jgi:hypothetical protein